MYWKTHYFAKTYPENYEKTIGGDIDGVDDDDDYEGDDDDDDQHNDDGCGDEDDVDQDNDDAMMVMMAVKMVRIKMTTKRRW